MAAPGSDSAAGARPSIRDVARRAGVSPGCVSNVINGRRPSDDAIGRAVTEAVEALGYRRNIMASNLRRSQSRIIGLVIPDFQNPFFAELVAELERCAEATQYRIVATSSREDPGIERREIDELTGWRVAGLLLVPALGSPVAAPEAPTVLLDRLPSGRACDGVGVDNAEATADVMRRLIALGHRRVLVAYLGDGIDNVTERLDGVRRVAAEGRVDVSYLATGNTVEGARSGLAGHLSAFRAPTAIFSLFNTATLAAYGLAQERGLVLGRDLALVGFDDSAWMAHVHPPVAAIVQPVREIAQQAWARLLARIEGNADGAEIARVKCRLEPRGTLTEAPETHMTARAAPSPPARTGAGQP